MATTPNKMTLLVLLAKKTILFGAELRLRLRGWGQVGSKMSSSPPKITLTRKSVLCLAGIIVVFVVVVAAVGGVVVNDVISVVNGY